jgi:E3 ubiquitin-protein ligase RNF13
VTYDSYTAAFGPHIGDDGFMGYVTLANPLSGCSKMESPPNISFVDPKKWIALIVRTPTIFDNCSFDVKVSNAQKAGFGAAIIYNSDSDNLIKMSSSGFTNIKIPSAFVGHSSGVEIGTYYTFENRTYAIIYNDDSDLNYMLIPFISVITICFLVAICTFVSIFCLSF